MGALSQSAWTIVPQRAGCAKKAIAREQLRGNSRSVTADTRRIHDRRRRVPFRTNDRKETLFVLPGPRRSVFLRRFKVAQPRKALSRYNYYGPPRSDLGRVGAFGTPTGAGVGFPPVLVQLLLCPESSRKAITGISVAVVFHSLSGSVADAGRKRIDDISRRMFALPECFNPTG